MYKSQRTFLLNLTSWNLNWPVFQIWNGFHFLHRNCLKKSSGRHCRRRLNHMLGTGHCVSSLSCELRHRTWTESRTEKLSACCYKLLHPGLCCTHLIVGCSVLPVIVELTLRHHLHAVQPRGHAALAQHVLEDGDAVVGLGARHLGVAAHGALGAGAVRQPVLVSLLVTLTRPGHCAQCRQGLWETKNQKRNYHLPLSSGG